MRFKIDENLPTESDRILTGAGRNSRTAATAFVGVPRPSGPHDPISYFFTHRFGGRATGSRAPTRATLKHRGAVAASIPVTNGTAEPSQIGLPTHLPHNPLASRQSLVSLAARKKFRIIRSF